MGMFFYLLYFMLPLTSSFLRSCSIPCKRLLKYGAVLYEYPGINFPSSDESRGVFERIESYRTYLNTTKQGYPRQANLNISYPSIDDIDEEMSLEDQEEFDKILRETIENEGKDEKRDGELPHDFSNLPIGIRVIMRQSSDDEKEKQSQSENFEVEHHRNFTFKDVGGYTSVKNELLQTIDILVNYSKYEQYNVRTPKGVILEGPPGNGKTLLAKALSGEVNVSFIAVSGSQFQEKYVGVGASRVRELFQLAEENKPCIIFIDEIDAIGRMRSSGESANQNTEKDATLNELLIAMDGYKSSDEIFVVGATNRADLLDKALVRPGRIDKQIYIANPDPGTRKEILDIHLKGKPHTRDVNIDNLIDLTNGLSGAQIENVLNEGMLYALRNGRTSMDMVDLETMLSRVLVGYQANENAYSSDMIKRIAVHELGHAIIGIFSPHHSKLKKVCLNSLSPTSPGYTIFELQEVDGNIYTRERLNSRLMVLLGGRIAEEVMFGVSITSGASKDIEEAYMLAEQMIMKFGMGRKTVYTHQSENAKTFIDKDIEMLIENSYCRAREIVLNARLIIDDASDLLVKKKTLQVSDIVDIIQKYNLKIPIV